MLNPGVLLDDDPRRTCGTSRSPRRGGGGGPVRGMRVLRAGVPQPRSDADPAAADRAAARDAARTQSATTSWPTNWRRPTTTRPADLRGRRHVRDRVPGADQHRGPGAAAAPGEPQPTGRRGWALAARHWGAVSRAPSCALTAAAAVPAVLPASQPGRPRGGRHRPVPLWSGELPRGGRPRRRPAPVGEADAVYLPACVNAMFGPADDGPGVQDSFEKLCAPAGIALLVHGESRRCAAGRPGRRRGSRAATRVMGERGVTAVDTATRDGELPVVSDASWCTEG